MPRIIEKTERSETINLQSSIFISGFAGLGYLAADCPEFSENS